MRFTLATAVLSMAAMVVAVPTNVLLGRGGTCAQGLTTQCCQASTGSADGILGNLLDLQCADILGQVPIIGAILGSTSCSGQLACCNLGSQPVSSPDCDDDSNSGGSQSVISIPILSNTCILQNVAL